MVFSNTSDGTGIVQQVRDLMRVDSTQWPTSRIVNSCNNYLDTVTGYLIGTDRRFQFDSSNHTKLPIGTTNLVANQSDYSFLTDEQNNPILTITRIDLLQATGGDYKQLKLIDQNEIVGALDEFESTAGIPNYYDKIADNIIRLYPKPSTSITAGLKFYFQRTSVYFTASDTTETTGMPPLLDRGFVINAAYDGALTLGLANLSALAVEVERENIKLIAYFKGRNNDEVRRMVPAYENNR